MFGQVKRYASLPIYCRHSDSVRLRVTLVQAREVSSAIELFKLISGFKSHKRAVTSSLAVSISLPSGLNEASLTANEPQRPLECSSANARVYVGPCSLLYRQTQQNLAHSHARRTTSLLRHTWNSTADTRSVGLTSPTPKQKSVISDARSESRGPY